ncbi:unnamed protein product [Blepharisma stoltei]|uniref:Uncharacterized protein n=1 Tax=Blepharisma stoltei TaxID=1481888 RepID=A0AAU9K5P1_9CILI|nr:unnamed protein product [Blepharisma stoltei]
MQLVPSATLYETCNTSNGTSCTACAETTHMSASQNAKVLVTQLSIDLKQPDRQHSLEISRLSDKAARS